METGVFYQPHDLKNCVFKHLEDPKSPFLKNIRYSCSPGKNLQKSCRYLQPHGEAGGGCHTSAHHCKGDLQLSQCAQDSTPASWAVPRASSWLLSSPAVFLAMDSADSGAQSGLSSPSARSAQRTSRSSDATGQAELVTSLAVPYLKRGSKGRDHSNCRGLEQ